jgi:Divergent InlB B-repeat domain
MNPKSLSITGLCILGLVLLSVPSCARNQHLTSIQVEPPGATFEGVGAQIQFKAFGTYIHPPATKDITAKVQWSIDSQNLADITSPGLVTSVSICGSGNLIASIHDGQNDLFGTAFLTGAGLGTPTCNQAVLTVSLSGPSGAGSVTSGPSGITCPSTCSAVFNLGTSVGLTANPAAGHSFVSWGNCDSQTGNACTLLLDANRTITATFN